jgi:hypothetical protein
MKVPYDSETWVLKENEIYKLMTFETKITRKIYGPTRTGDGYWRIKISQEINDILKGHVERMNEEDSIVQKIMRWKPMSKRPIGRPKTSLEDGVLGEMRKINVNNWKK